MKIFIDFDDVLFNTNSFVEDIEKIFAGHGVSEKVFKKYYREPKSEKESKIIRKYNPYEQIKRIKASGIRIGALDKSLKSFLKDTRKYLFKDGKKFLNKLKKEDLYVVSYGDRKFQMEKIKNSGIAKYFKKIVIADVSKAVGIRKILKCRNIIPGEALIFIDDRAKFLEDIKKSYPGMATFLFKRKEGRYDDMRTKYCDFEVRDFEEVLDVIENC
jgi:FMN phosphatase YigB (HAD superfamily)